MPLSTKTEIQVEFVTEIDIDIEQETDVFSLSQTSSFLVDRTEFVNRFMDKHKNLLSKEEIIHFWHTLFGDHPLLSKKKTHALTSHIGLNPNYHFLTPESCEQILNHYSLFKNGMDFEHLPAGFYVNKNHQNGTLDVIDFSESYKKYQLKHHKTSPLAITLSEKKTPEHSKNTFKGAQKEWYEFFLKKAPGYCSIDELRRAFISFSNVIRKFDLKFYPADFSQLSEDCNPIILLGRLTTVMTNFHLRPQDRQVQWENLLQLPLIESHKAIRALTDYQTTNTPCTFLLPEMGFDIFPYQTSPREPCFWYAPNDVLNHKNDTPESKLYINQLRELNPEAHLASKEDMRLNSVWRLLAYEKERLSLNFYKYAWSLFKPIMDVKEGEKPLNEMELVHKKKMVPNTFHLIALDTIGSNHLKFTEEYEQEQTKLLEDIITILTKTSTVVKILEVALGRGVKLSFRSLETNPIQYNIDDQSNKKEVKNLRELYEEFINESEEDKIKRKALENREYKDFDDANNITINGVNLLLSHQLYLFIVDNFNSNPLTFFNELIPLFNTLIKIMEGSKKYRKDYFLGAKFYFTQTHGFIEYANLQEYLDKKIAEQPNQLALHLVPLLSTFSLYDNQSVDNALTLLAKVKYPDRINNVLEFFKEAISQQPTETLNALITLVDQFPQEITDTDLLTNLEKKYHSIFPPNYFANKKKQLSDALEGINSELESMLKAYGFHDNEFANLLALEIKFFKKNPWLSTHNLQQVNDSLFALKRLISPAEFTQLTKYIATFPAGNINELENLIVCLVNKRSTSAFNQIMACNLRERREENLALKTYYFIEMIRPLTLELKTTFNDKNLIQEALASLVLNTKLVNTNSVHECVNVVKYILDKLTNVLKSQAAIKNHLFQSLFYLPNKQEDTYLDNVQAYFDAITRISELLGDNAADKLVCFSLFAHFNKSPQTLTDLINSMQTAGLTDEKQQFLLKLVSQMKDNYKRVDDINKLIVLIAEDAHYTALSTHCKTPPYPSIGTLIQWLNAGNLKESFEAFGIEPFGPRRLDYAFQLTDYKRQAKQFTFMKGDKNPFTQELASKLSTLLTANRTKSILTLQQEFSALKSPVTVNDNLQLLALCVEMLARTTSQLDLNTANLISQELNATQIMALWGMITNPSAKLLTEIDTGEGKSRITMIMAAFYAAQGKTVDIITQDLALSERDFLSYRSFFNALSIPTSFIDLNTPPSLYLKNGGVNFSDNSQLLLLRNKSDITLTPNDYLDENEKNRVLLIDEADEFIHDKSEDSYNFAIKSKTLSDFVWIYPYLVDFVKDELKTHKKEMTFNQNLINCFMEFVTNSDNDITHIEALASLNDANKTLLLTWLNSAHTALNMKIDRDYKVTSPEDNKRIPMKGPDGNTYYSRQVLVMKNGRPAIGSTFAHGVHQCLCAIENKKSESQDFVIQAENEVQRASYPVTFIEKYNEGRVVGVTGTSRSEAPKAHPEINYQQYHYLKVPRHHALRRTDQCIWHAKNDDQQIQFILFELLKSLRANPPQPTLIICKDDKQSAALQKKLNANKEIQTLLKNIDSTIRRVEGLSEKKDELDAIATAGEKGNITLSTVGMFGRGVDIHADNLSVIATYIPTIEDEIQIKGRTARAGKEGQYRLIPAINDPDAPIKGRTHDIRREVLKTQHQNAFSAVFQEEIANLYAEFLEGVTLVFLDNLKITPLIESEKRLLAWQTYLNNMQKDWTTHKQPLMEAFESGKEENFKTTFIQFTDKWKNQLTVQLNIEVSDKSKNLEKVYQSLSASQRFFNQPQTLKTLRKARYERADDGQARIYNSVFEPIYATFRGERPLFADFRAWLDGRGQIFPDLMATLYGERPLFVHLREWISELIDTISKCFSSSSEAELPNDFAEEELEEVNLFLRNPPPSPMVS